MARPVPDPALVAALRQPNTFPIKAIEFGAYHYCDDNYHSDSGGSFNGKVKDWATLDQPASERTYSMESPLFSVTLDDKDGSIEGSIVAGGTTGVFAVGAAVLVKVGAKTVVYSKWYTTYTGVVAGYRKIASHRYQIVVRPNDLALRREIMHPEWTIGNDWRTAPPENQQIRTPAYFGQYDSTARGGGGAVPLYQVDTLTWLLGAGYNQAIDRLYDDGELLNATAWTRAVVTRGGRTYDTVTLTEAPTGDITADIRGLTDNGNGGGTLLTNPIDQLLYALVNFVMGQWQSGAWLSASSYPVDQDSFTAAKTFLAKLANGGPQGALKIDKVQTGKVLLDAWSQSAGFGTYFADAGGVALMVDDHTRQDYPAIGSWPRPEEIELNGETPQPDRDLDAQADRVTLTLPSGLRFVVRDPTAPTGGVPAPKAINMIFARAYL